MKEHGTYLVPTLYLSDWFMENYKALGLSEGIIAKARAVMPAARENVGHAFHEGVKVAFGTDAAVYPHGLNAHEFAVMVKLGLTPLQAIQSATVNAADLLGWQDRVGTLEAGKFADLVAVDGDPLAGCELAGKRESGDQGRRNHQAVTGGRAGAGSELYPSEGGANQRDRLTGERTWLERSCAAV